MHADSHVCSNENLFKNIQKAVKCEFTESASWRSIVHLAILPLDCCKQWLRRWRKQYVQEKSTTKHLDTSLAPDWGTWHPIGHFGYEEIKDYEEFQFPISATEVQKMENSISSCSLSIHAVLRAFNSSSWVGFEQTKIQYWSEFSL